MSSAGSQTSARPPPKPNVLKSIDSRATLPARIIRSAQESYRPYFCLIGQSSRRALSRFALSGQLLRGAKRCWPLPAPPRPSAMRYVPALCHVLRIRHQGMKILDHCVQVESLELLGVVELLAHGIGLEGVLVENLNVQLVRPPVTVRPGYERAFARTFVSLCVHVSLRACSALSRSV